jgi:hypothetical protein
MTFNEQHHTIHAGLWKKCGTYGFLFFFLKGIFWVVAPWIIYILQ